jgi:hypothetical protein
MARVDSDRARRASRARGPLILRLAGLTPPKDVDWEPEEQWSNNRKAILCTGGLQPTDQTAVGFQLVLGLLQLGRDGHGVCVGNVRTLIERHNKQPKSYYPMYRWPGAPLATDGLGT